MDIAGIDTIIVVPDNDIASEKFIDAIVKLCKHSYNIKVVEPQYDDDIGECSIDQIKNILGTFIKDK